MDTHFYVYSPMYIHVYVYIYTHYMHFWRSPVLVLYYSSLRHDMFHTWTLWGCRSQRSHGSAPRSVVYTWTLNSTPPGMWLFALVGGGPFVGIPQSRALQLGVLIRAPGFLETPILMILFWDLPQTPTSWTMDVGWFMLCVLLSLVWGLDSPAPTFWLLLSGYLQRQGQVGGTPVGASFTGVGPVFYGLLWSR